MKGDKKRSTVIEYWMELVKTGDIDTSWGKFYDLIFNSRQRGDYQELVSFSPEETEELISQAEGFIAEMENLLKI